jgi:hypothetical protein
MRTKARGSGFALPDKEAMAETTGSFGLFKYAAANRSRCLAIIFMAASLTKKIKHLQI